MKMKEVIKKAREFAISEIEKFGTPPALLFEASFKQGQILAKKYGANKDIVALGTILMDVKLGEAKSLGKINEHIKMSADASEEFLKKLNVDKDVIDNMLECINEHHGVKKFSSTEAEVCANADCYRFLRPDLIMAFITGLTGNGMKVDDAVKFTLKKIEEKHKILSLPKAIKDLRTYYATMKEFLQNGVLKDNSDIFYHWNAQKSIADKGESEDIYFSEREIWFIKAGKNVGYEQDGSGDDFLRPALILRKFNKDVFWGIFLSTTEKRGKYYYEVTSDGKEAVVILSQIKLLSRKRLHTKIDILSVDEVLKIKKAVSEILNGSFDF